MNRSRKIAGQLTKLGRRRALNKATIAKIESLARLGLAKKHIAAAIGVHQSILCRWDNYGRAELDRIAAAQDVLEALMQRLSLGEAVDDAEIQQAQADVEVVPGFAEYVEYVEAIDRGQANSTGDLLRYAKKLSVHDGPTVLKMLAMKGPEYRAPAGNVSVDVSTTSGDDDTTTTKVTLDSGVLTDEDFAQAGDHLVRVSIERKRRLRAAAEAEAGDDPG